MNASQERHLARSAERRGVPLEQHKAEVLAAIDAFNADDSKTHKSHPDGREHVYARLPIFEGMCDIEIVGFSGIGGMSVG